MLKSINILLYGGIFMNSLILQEIEQRGTSDFPVSHYPVTKKHPRYNMQMHWHKDIELMRVTKGRLDCTTGDVSYSLVAGDSIYVPSGITHGATPHDCEYECVVFSPSVLYSTQRIRQVIKSQIIYPVKFSKNSEIDKVCDSLREKTPGYEFEVVSALCKTARLALSEQSFSNVPSNSKAEKIKPALYFIQKNFGEKISLSSLAAECGMSPNYFCKLFRDITGQTPVEYITTYRLEMASEMLLDGAKVTDVAYDCGFSDLSYFIHIFKKELGISPKQYAKTQ